MRNFVLALVIVLTSVTVFAFPKHVTNLKVTYSSVDRENLISYMWLEDSTTGTEYFVSDSCYFYCPSAKLGTTVYADININRNLLTLYDFDDNSGKLRTIHFAIVSTKQE